MADFFCPDCGWEGQEDKKALHQIPCPICGQPALAIDLPEADQLGREPLQDDIVGLDELEEDRDDLVETAD